VNTKSGQDDNQMWLYRIVVKGLLDENWVDWLSKDMVISTEPNKHGFPTTVLTCKVIDQSQLRGILTKLFDLNLSIVSVNLLDE
jgi:hypothetical protein